MNIVTRYVLVGIVSASLVAPAQAFDLGLWFNSLSERSRTAMYLGAATVVAGLSLLTYKLWNTKKVQPEVVKAADGKEQAIKKLEEDKAGLTTQCEALEKQLKAEATHREAQQKEGQQRAHDKERLKATVQETKNKLDQLKQDHAKLKADITTNLNNGLADINQLFEKTQHAMQYNQEKALATLVRSLDEKEVEMIIFALESRNYNKLSAPKELLLKSWSEKTRAKALSRLKDKQARIEKKKKEKQALQAAKERKKQEMRDEEAKVTAAMDKALAAQKSNGNGKQHNGQHSRFVVSEPVTRAKKA